MSRVLAAVIFTLGATFGTAAVATAAAAESAATTTDESSDAGITPNDTGWN
jgi:hypothetical protein